MSELMQYLNIGNSNTTLHQILKKCANYSSSESVLTASALDYYTDADVYELNVLDNVRRMSITSQALSDNFSASSVNSDNSFPDNILEEHGRISLAYENLERIPKRIAEKFAAHTQLLDLSYNNFQNLSFLAYFEELHTLILDRNTQLKAHTLPYLPNLKILWINNCNIQNVTEWIQRIEMQCAALEQLSIMGNPGINNKFSYCTLAPYSVTPISLVTDYRNYILDILPNLQYLDGIPRETVLFESQNVTYKASSSSPDSGHSNESNVSSSKSSFNSNKFSPTLKLKNLFKLPLRKTNSYQTSSNN